MILCDNSDGQLALLYSARLTDPNTLLEILRKYQSDVKRNTS
jgi:hypothetical protein